LNIGGTSKDIPLPEFLKDYEHVLLDCYQTKEPPDILMDAHELEDTYSMKEKYDAVYCSHTLEHFPVKGFGKILRGLFHVLKKDGFLIIRVPDVVQAVQDMVSNGRQFHQQCRPEDPDQNVRLVTYQEIIYGRDHLGGNPNMMHHQAFTLDSLVWGLEWVGFKIFHGKERDLEITLIAFKQEPKTEVLELIYGKDSLEDSSKREENI
jgi:predicted SAM-dependent methyltransferase